MSALVPNRLPIQICRTLIHLPFTPCKKFSSHKPPVKALYLEKPLLLSHASSVVAQGTTMLADRKFYWVRLSETIFHPQGGGQPSDQGTIDGLPVQKVIKTPLLSKDHFQFEIDHLFTAPPPFKPGQKVLLEINKEVRGQNTRLHSAGHAIAQLMEKHFPPLKAMTGHHFPGEARVVFEGSINHSNEIVLEYVQKELDELIAKKTPSRIGVSAAGERLHIIGDFPGMGCGGTHVEHLGELIAVAINQIKEKKKQLHVSYRLDAHSKIVTKKE